MATLAKYKEHKDYGGSSELVEIVYDFAVDGGSVAALDVLKLKADSIVSRAWFVVLTTCTSGGSATVSLGKSGDAAGIIGATAVASLTAGAVIYGSTPDASNTMAADAVVQLDIATAALTAGKIKVIMEIIKQ